MSRILIADPINDAGVHKLIHNGHDVDVKVGLSQAEIVKIINLYDALVVRSETKVTSEILSAADRLQVVGRAGVGVDNIDLDAATNQGIAVVNAPSGNTIAAAEHAIALILALARNIPQADASIREGKWKRSDFMGVELKDKNFGVIGLGKVGSEVVRRLKAFQAHIIAYDPYIPVEFARSLGVELVEMDRLLADSDFISIHTPLTASTSQLLGLDQFPKLKHGVRIINAARGGLVDEQLLEEGLNSGTIAGAAIDVFETEPPASDLPLLKNKKAIFTPHLGASTNEAQVAVAIEVAEEVCAVLSGGAARYTVNIPTVPAEVREALGEYIPVANVMGKIAIQLADGQLENVSLRVAGPIAEFDISLLASAVIAGILDTTSGTRVNLVNAPRLAKERGLEVNEIKSIEPDSQYSNLVGVEVRTSTGSVYLAGSSFGSAVHLLRLNDFFLDMQPQTSYMLFMSHRDQPGMIGKVGTIAGSHDLNIAFMEVGRSGPRGAATMVVGFDDPLSDSQLEEIRGIAGVEWAKVVKL